jgi:hypothetical protein
LDPVVVQEVVPVLNLALWLAVGVEGLAAAE